MSGKHIADAESIWRVMNISPDFCKVGGKVVPFDIYQTLQPERANYAKTVYARGEKVLHVDSIIRGVIGNAGSGISSGVSQGSGHTLVVEGAKTVFVRGKMCARHKDRVCMNRSG
jgi:hypothetical protein